MFRTVVGVGLILGMAACAEAPPTAPLGPEQSLLGGLMNATLLRCNSLSYSSSSAVIGSGGGTLTVGPHRLVVPAGALAADVTITGEVIPGSVNSVRFSPEGLTFAAPAALTMSYRNCPLAALLPLKKVAYTDEGLSILSLLHSLDDLAAREVTGQLEHFSRYAIAY